MRYCARRRAAACCGTLACTVASSARALARSPSSPRPADTMAWITRRLSSWVRRLARATAAAARRHAARNNCAPPRRPRCGPAPDRRACAWLRAAAPSAARRSRPNRSISRTRRSRRDSSWPDCARAGAGIGLRQAALVAAAGRDGRQLVQLLFIQHGARLGQPGLGDADVVVALQRQADQPVQLRILQLLPPVALQLAVGEQRLFGAGQRHRRGLRLLVVGPLRSPPRPGPAPARRRGAQAGIENRMLHVVFLRRTRHLPRAPAQLAGARRIAGGAVVAREHGVHGGQHEQREQGAHQHAHHDHQPQAVAAVRAGAGGEQQRDQPTTMAAVVIRMGRSRMRAACSIAPRRSRLWLICISLANSTIRMPCLLIRPISVTSPICV